MVVSLCLIIFIERTNQLAQNYYYRVSDFAKEMLVNPQLIDLHHNNSGIFETESPRGKQRA